MSQFSLINFFLPKLLLDENLTKSLTGREMSRKKGLEDAEIQKLHTTAPELLTDDELLLAVHFVQKALPGNTPLTTVNDARHGKQCGRGMLTIPFLFLDISALGQDKLN
jgi:hypothetical protein